MKIMSAINKKISSILTLIIFISEVNYVAGFTTPGLIGKGRVVAASNTNTLSGAKASTSTTTSLHMAKGGKKKRRRRKNAPPQVPSSPSSPSSNTLIPDDDIEAAKELSQSGAQASIDELKAIANFQAPSSSSGATTTTTATAPPTIPNNINVATTSEGAGLESDNLVELPDIRDALKNKELKRIEEEEALKQQRPKISRRDTKAFLELLEAEPFADADDSYFEDEEYGTVSALLGEGAKSFLGIPPGPLQVGHFIGSLGIILCAFIEYPGFPLTNLPTPLRDALQGGAYVV